VARRTSYSFERNQRAKAKAAKQEAKREAKAAARAQKREDEGESEGSETEQPETVSSDSPDPKHDETAP